MSTNDISNNGVNGTGFSNDEGSSPGRDPMDEQRGPSRNHVTASMKWTKAINVAVMECYYLSNPVNESDKPLRGYRQRMHMIWNEREMLKCSEQRLCDQVRAIRKNEWLTRVELETIKRRVLEEVEPDVAPVDVRDSVAIEDVTVQGVQQEQIEFKMSRDDMNEEEREMIISIVDRMKERSFNVPRGFKKIESSKLDEETKK